MTAMREEAFELLEKMPEDKLVFIIQIMQGVNSLYNSGDVESKKDAFLRMEKIRKKGNVQDDDAELASDREEKYGK